LRLWPFALPAVFPPVAIVPFTADAFRLVGLAVRWPRSTSCKPIGPLPAGLNATDTAIRYLDFRECPRAFADALRAPRHWPFVVLRLCAHACAADFTFAHIHLRCFSEANLPPP
jgi:hypothetical protein